MKRLDLDFKSLQLKGQLSREYYKKEARGVVKKYNQNDRNFKYFFLEFVDITKENVDVEALREAVSMLQRHVCLRINLEQSTDSEPDVIRNKIKSNKRRH